MKRKTQIILEVEETIALRQQQGVSILELLCPRCRALVEAALSPAALSSILRAPNLPLSDETPEESEDAAANENRPPD